MDRPSRQSGEERAFRDAVGVQVGETCHGLIEDRVQLPILYKGCPRRNVPDFGRVFLMLKYTDITQNT